MVDRRGVFVLYVILLSPGVIAFSLIKSSPQLQLQSNEWMIVGSPQPQPARWRRLQLATKEAVENGGSSSSSSKTDVDLERIKIGDNRDFWAQQKVLAAEMSSSLSSSLASSKSVAAREKFAKRRLALVGDTAYIGLFLFCFLWLINDDPFVPLSYSLGSVLGVAYAYGLGKYVESMGGSIDDMESTRGAGVGEARFAFLILLFVIVGKFRDTGMIQELPAIAGFFTYQLASLRQGLKEIND